jgi:hypothetical protein
VLCISVFSSCAPHCIPPAIYCAILLGSHYICCSCCSWFTLMICSDGIRSFSGSSWVERCSDQGTPLASSKTMRQSFFHTYNRVFEQANLSTNTCADKIQTCLAQVLRSGAVTWKILIVVSALSRCIYFLPKQKNVKF